MAFKRESESVSSTNSLRFSIFESTKNGKTYESFARSVSLNIEFSTSAISLPIPLLSTCQVKQTCSGQTRKCMNSRMKSINDVLWQRSLVWRVAEKGWFTHIILLLRATAYTISKSKDRLIRLSGNKRSSKSHKSNLRRLRLSLNMLLRRRDWIRGWRIS